jgi:L-alanine-DL-glutamate epimerase-like enolase superfamily enzyme
VAARGPASAWLEVDSNENPLRSLLCPPLERLKDGALELGDGPGLGIEPDLKAIIDLCAR